MEQAIIVLVVVGFLMIAAEVFVPGLVLGTLGFLCLAAAVVLCYMAFGPLAGTVAFAVVGVVTTAAFLIWMKIFPGTPLGRRVMLRSSLEPKTSSPVVAGLLGESGVAITPLRPSGTAKIADRRLDVVAESGFIDSGEPVTVVLHEGLRIVVRKQTAPDTTEKPD